MKNLRERIMAANFSKLLKRWIIAALCVALLGGGVSVALLAPWKPSPPFRRYISRKINGSTIFRVMVVTARRNTGTGLR